MTKVLVADWPFDLSSNSTRRINLIAGGWSRIAPLTTGDRRYDALLAALVEYCCVRHGMPSPAWVDEPSRFLEEWWFVSGIRSLHTNAVVHSPVSFKRRGVFIAEDALTYA